MKKWCMALLLTVALLSTCAALAQEPIGPACAALRVDLLERPQEDARVLMTYHIGTRVEVVREVDERYVEVIVGKEGGSLTGYMEKPGLVFGEMAIREVRAQKVWYMPYEPGVDVTLYSAMDEQSDVIDPAFIVGLKQVMGSRGRWLHIDDMYNDVTGFVRLDEIALEGPNAESEVYIRVDPAQGEMTREEAVAAAKEMILSDENPNRFGGTDDTAVTAELLDACQAQVDVLYYYGETALTYIVDFRNAETGYIDAGISFQVEGKEILSAHAGNG